MHVLLPLSYQIKVLHILCVSTSVIDMWMSTSEEFCLTIETCTGVSLLLCPTAQK